MLSDKERTRKCERRNKWSRWWEALAPLHVQIFNSNLNYGKSLFTATMQTNLHYVYAQIIRSMFVRRWTSPRIQTLCTHTFTPANRPAVYYYMHGMCLEFVMCISKCNWSWYVIHSNDFDFCTSTDGKRMCVCVDGRVKRKSWKNGTKRSITEWSRDLKQDKGRG